MKIDEEIKNRIDHLANVVVQNLKTNSRVFMNFQIEEEYSQYDILFSYKFTDYGTHQRGITNRDLLIGIVGFGTYGFSVAIPDTDPGYYKEKLGVSSNFLAFLFNEIRKKLSKESQ